MNILNFDFVISNINVVFYIHIIILIIVIYNRIMKKLNIIGQVIGSGYLNNYELSNNKDVSVEDTSIIKLNNIKVRNNSRRGRRKRRY